MRLQENAQRPHAFARAAELAESKCANDFDVHSFSMHAKRRQSHAGAPRSPRIELSLSLAQSKMTPKPKTIEQLAVPPRPRRCRSSRQRRRLDGSHFVADARGRNLSRATPTPCFPQQRRWRRARPRNSIIGFPPAVVCAAIPLVDNLACCIAGADAAARVHGRPTPRRCNTPGRAVRRPDVVGGSGLSHGRGSRAAALWTCPPRRPKPGSAKTAAHLGSLPGTCSQAA